MRIAVVGCGFVGGTVADILEENDIKVLRVDPKYYELSLPDAIAGSDAAIVCLPTPQHIDNGSCDGQVVINVIGEISALDDNFPIMLKSTITPDYMELLPSDVIYNPEFLKEASAKKDFKKQHAIILGKGELCKEEHLETFVKLYETILPDTPIEIVDRNSASIIKYMHNAWLATKVAFFHQLYAINLNTSRPFDYDKVTEVLSKFENIGPSHMKAPNEHGTLGYGGSCFPKDMQAINEYFKKEGCQHNIVDEVTVVNNNLNKILIDKYKDEVPDEPYVICLGTSHTFGECEGKKTPTTFWDEISETLGIRMLNVGLSGAKQIEFIQIVNELENYGYLGHNCKGLIFETRITDASFEFNLENLMHFGEIDKVRIENKNGRMPLLHRTGWGPLKPPGDDGEINFNPTMNNFLFGQGSPDMITEEQILVQYNEIFNAQNEQVYVHSTKKDVTKLMDKLDFDLAFSNKNVASAFRDFQYLDIIKNLIVSKGIPFGWFLMDPRDKLLRNCQALLNNKTDIFDYQMVESSVGDLIEALISVEGGDIDDLKCGCKHWNEEGSRYVAQLLTEPVRRIIE